MPGNKVALADCTLEGVLVGWGRVWVGCGGARVVGRDWEGAQCHCVDGFFSMVEWPGGRPKLGIHNMDEAVI